jgi:energy-coupling factor transporter transmembrane protein EcfT
MWALFADMPFGFPLTAAQVRYEIGLAWGTALSDPKVYIPLLAAVVVLVASRWGSSGAREFPALLVVAALGWTLHHVHTEAFTTMEGSVDVVSCSRQGWDSVPSGELVRPFSLYALAMGLRINAFLAAGLLLISTTRVEAFAAGLRSLGLPPPMCFALSLGFRLMPTYADTAITVVQAQRSRGQDFDRGGVIQRLRRYVPLLVPVLAYALRRADGLAMALESKGFSAARRRTEFLPLRFTLADLVVLLVLVAVAAGSIWARSMGHGVVLDRL